KFASNDKWMAGVQAGINLRTIPDVEFTFAAGYFDFMQVQGKLGDKNTDGTGVCHGDVVTVGCNTDLRRPSFAQKGNTYMALRNITP
ncbi:putative porin, partial [Acinetobacter baumannii]